MGQQLNESEPSIKPIIVELLRTPAEAAEWIDRCATRLAERLRDGASRQAQMQAAATSLESDPAFAGLAPEEAADKFQFGDN